MILVKRHEMNARADHVVIVFGTVASILAVMRDECKCSILLFFPTRL